MDKNTTIRTVAAVVICTVFFLVWNFYFSPKREVAPPVAQTQQGTDEYAPPADVSVPQPSVVASEPVIIDTSSYNIAFDSNTGDIRYVDFHAYKLGEESIAPKFMRTDNRNADYAAINAGIVSGFTHTVQQMGDSTVVTFTAENSQLQVTKTYTINDREYLIPVNISVRNVSGTAVTLPLTATIGPGLGEGFDNEKYVYNGPMIYTKGNLEKKAAKDVKKPIVIAEPQWGGYTSKYFLFALVSDSFERAEIVKFNSSAVTQFAASYVIQPDSELVLSDTSFFIGPKYYEDLKAYGIGMQKSIDFGVFAFLAIPMTKIMQFAYKFVHNYGVAIIILTFLIKIITLPLTMKSMKSMRALSKLQPEMKALREKYKDEPQKMNAAMMALYKEHGANPMSGCLPMIIQLPIFFALYKSLLVSIELKGAPFFGWIVDLSAKDPYYITPILMGASMFLVQKLTPSGGDPMQQKILMFMPVIFTFLFLNFPAGLVIYWLTNNVLSIIQQYVINKKAA